MQSNSFDAQLRSVSSLLEQRSGATFTGSQLSSLIASAAPDLDVRAVVGIPKGPGALTEFIRKYLADMVERVGHQGGDVLYRIKGTEPEALPPSAASLIWRTFVSPNSKQHLILTPDPFGLVVRDTGASIDQEEIEICKATVEEHDQMRARFASSLPENIRQEFQSRVNESLNFPSWLSAIKEYYPELTQVWGQYRREQLSSIFVSRVSSLGISEDQKEKIVNQIKNAELSAYTVEKNTKKIISTQNQRGTKMLESSEVAVYRARQLARAAIDNLSYEELRALKIPLGAMIDALQWRG